MNDDERDPGDVLAEAACYLALVATRRLYEQQPELWRRGEAARAHTREDFEHHFAVLATLDPVILGYHAAYCTGLFRARNYPLAWLEDAWRTMEAVVAEELPDAVAAPASKILLQFRASPMS